MSQLNDLAAKIVKGQQTAQQRRTNPDGLTLPSRKALEASITDQMNLSTPAASPAKVGAKGKEKAPAEAKPGKSILVNAGPPGKDDAKAKEDPALLKAVKDR